MTIGTLADSLNVGMTTESMGAGRTGMGAEQILGIGVDGNPPV